MPDRKRQIICRPVGFGQTCVSDEILRIRAQYTLKQIDRLGIFLLLEKDSPKEAIRGYMTGLLLKDCVTVCGGFIKPVFIQQPFNIS